MLVLLLAEAALVVAIRPRIDGWANIEGVVENLIAAGTVYVTLDPLPYGAETAVMGAFCINVGLGLLRPLGLLVRDHLPRFVAWVRRALCGGGGRTVGPRRHTGTIVNVQSVDSDLLLIPVLF